MDLMSWFHVKGNICYLPKSVKMIIVENAIDAFNIYCLPSNLTAA